MQATTTHTDHANSTSPVSSLDPLLPSAVSISIAQPLERDERWTCSNSPTQCGPCIGKTGTIAYLLNATVLFQSSKLMSSSHWNWIAWVHCSSYAGHWTSFAQTLDPLQQVKVQSVMSDYNSLFFTSFRSFSRTKSPKSGSKDQKCFDGKRTVSGFRNLNWTRHWIRQRTTLYFKVINRHCTTEEIFIASSNAVAIEWWLIYAHGRLGDN